MKSTRSPSTSKPPRLRVGLKDIGREEFAAAVQEKLGKQRVSIMLDASVIAFFKAKAGERGYQTLINQTLHRAMTGDQIEAALRRVIREELNAA
jgi:uncharacterized protein (DUF4415 family)